MTEETTPEVVVPPEQEEPEAAPEESEAETTETTEATPTSPVFEPPAEKSEEETLRGVFEEGAAKRG